MEYISVKQAADKWDTSVQIVRRFCRQDRISGAIQRNGAWLIPATARKPKRIEDIEEPEELSPLAKTLLRQKKKKNFHGLYDYVQTDFTYSSCRMASNRLTRGQVETIFKKGKVSVSFEPMKVSDLVEVLNHCVCVDYILDHIERIASGGITEKTIAVGKNRSRASSRGVYVNHQALKQDKVWQYLTAEVDRMTGDPDSLALLYQELGTGYVDNMLSGQELDKYKVSLYKEHLAKTLS